MKEVIINMMHTYFLNKDRIKRIKMWRKDYMQGLVAENKEICDFACIVVGDDAATCSQCRRRNAYYQDIKKISHVNSGLIRSIKKKVYKLNTLTNDEVPF